MAPLIYTFENLESLSQAILSQWLFLAKHAIEARGRFVVALSGGNTPLPIYKLLAKNNEMQRYWQNTHVFWGDERCVAPEDPGSSYGQAEKLIFNQVPISTKNIYRIKGELEPTYAANEYTKQLQYASLSGLWPRFDLVLLGLGTDGHTASLFPGKISEQELTSSTLTVTANYEDRPAHRITLTPLVFNAARNIFFLSIGEAKAKAISEVIYGKQDIQRWPAQRIKPVLGKKIWFLDQKAASKLPVSKIAQWHPETEKTITQHLVL